MAGERYRPGFKCAVECFDDLFRDAVCRRVFVGNHFKKQRRPIEATAVRPALLRLIEIDRLIRPHCVFVLHFASDEP